MAGVELRSEVRGPAPADVSDRRDDYWRYLEWLLLGLFQYRDGTFYGLGVPLIRTGPPEQRGGAWAWPITGGLLAAQPGGEIGFGVENGKWVGFLHGYRPRIPEPLYSLTQKQVHQVVTRLFLLHERGRRQPPGVPAPPALRLAAAAADGALIAGAARVFGRRRGVALGAAYLAGAWVMGGQTLGQRLFGLRVVSTDGSPVTPAQALLRVVTLPLAAIQRRALHDEVAGTEVIEAG